jgi:hypothetical protein
MSFIIKNINRFFLITRFFFTPNRTKIGQKIHCVYWPEDLPFYCHGLDANMGFDPTLAPGMTLLVCFLKALSKEISRPQCSLAPGHSVFFGPFLSGCFFPPNDRAQNHAQETPLLVLFLLAKSVSGRE